jgi:polysaccharide pyruvyl transferase CsaB
MARSLVFVSGYYGFDNLGDEAILEELCTELKQLVKPEEIVVLSANPELTAKRYGVRSMQRKSLMDLWTALTEARLFVSGGGGLFQNTRTIGSIIYYGLQILMAKAHQAKVVIYAQGIGPLRGKLAENMCRQFFSQADELTVRDDASVRYLENWRLKGQRTADPVWNLAPSELPDSVRKQLNAAGAGRKKSKCVGLSLRPSPDLTDEHLKNLATALDALLAKDEQLLLLPLQIEQDMPVLQKFQQYWQEKSRSASILDSSALELPSQWVELFAQLKLLVGMRLHAIIMALKSGRPVAGIAYDPKVTQLLSEFGQCCLILTKESAGKDWPDAIKSLATGLDSYSKLAESKAAGAKELSCQNFAVLARILNMPRD